MGKSKVGRGQIATIKKNYPWPRGGGGKKKPGGGGLTGGRVFFKKKATPKRGKILTSRWRLKSQKEHDVDAKRSGQNRAVGGGLT